MANMSRSWTISVMLRGNCSDRTVWENRQPQTYFAAGQCTSGPLQTWSNGTRCDFNMWPWHRNIVGFPFITFYTPHFTLHTLHSTLYTPHFTLYSPHFALYTFHSTLLTFHSTLLSLHLCLYTLHSTRHIFYSTLYAAHSTLYAPFLLCHMIPGLVIIRVGIRVCGFHLVFWIGECFTWVHTGSFCCIRDGASLSDLSLGERAILHSVV